MLTAEHFLPERPDDPFSIASRHLDVLWTVLRPGVRLAIWHRDPLEASLDGLLDKSPFCHCAEDIFDTAAERVLSALPIRAPAPLAEDIHQLVGISTVLFGSDRVRVRLEAITGDGCPRYHADVVGLRLLCTYAGAGTQWLPMAGGSVTARALDRRRDYAPNTVPTGAVAILKGEAWPDQSGQGCIHRSPPGRGENTPRLLLCIDEPGRIAVP